MLRAAVMAIGTLAAAVNASAAESRLDRVHDWVYARLEHFLARFDAHFVRVAEEPIVVPTSPLRITFDSIVLHRQEGYYVAGRPDIEATVRLPNLERRLRLFISSNDRPESAANPLLDHNPVHVGLRFSAQSPVSVDLGLRVQLRPVVFGALKWAPLLKTEHYQVYPLMKLYLESGLGLGASGGLSVERKNGLWLARSTGFADWQRHNGFVTWTQSVLFGYAQALLQEGRYDRLSSGHDLACGAVALLSVSGDRSTRASLYEAGVLIKRPLHGGWLLGYVEPEIRWERTRAWHPEPGIRVGLDALFWGMAAAPTQTIDHCH